MRPESNPQPPERMAIFGGTFDPIHLAHVTVAREAREKFSLTKVLFIPAAHPPHKDDQGVAPFEHRLRMVELACAGEPAFVASALEAGGERSYSIRTLERVRQTLAPHDRLYFLIGADAFAEIGSWYRFEDVLRGVEFIVVTRPGHEYQAPEGAVVHRLDTLALPVSSSDIRQKLAAGLEPEELDPRVIAYIREHQLYA
ncbi:MAG: nicotinate (nicotinamide) nucleotide adenylyltransferase [Acidobacteria bacterium]|nr:nicotinate (nicotinamide) nucleotide adenylyltransferase [Acidobacteriota bacterium]